MCGSAPEFVPPKKTEGWNGFCYHLAQHVDKRDMGLFVEIVRGCKRPCPLECSATKQEVSIMNLESLLSIMQFLRFNSLPVLLFGVGDSALFDWVGFNMHHMNHTFSDFRTNLRLGDYMSIRSQAEFPKGFEVYINVFTLEDAIGLNRINFKNYFDHPSVFGKLIVSRRDPLWIEIMKSLRKSTLITSLTPSWSPDYIGLDEFKSIVKKEIGINVGNYPPVKEITVTNSYKPIIEQIVIGLEQVKIIMRRCFLQDSKKVEFSIPVADDKYYWKMQDWLKSDEKTSKILSNFFNERLDCKSCNETKWTWFWKM